ncbi:type II toxin-antitoxin system RelB/DinJ family antitoxin [Fibrobacter sp. UWR2]|uniref:type II toxin-antitoxin system RelB/DinJ family antitoxin n=1 Tax=Fibrobacter sp. UWR2 TaxID=1964352 RepID=UPI000B51EE64|nr:type II toxin-antitoxin system RelB/DinJ family antitoxin [Fibrobacter sp. UWR2]OWV01078.1 translation repressor RelB [Fibrobacter sp. UWR2]
MATTVMQIRVDEDLKNDAAKILENLGMDVPTAIRVFFKRVVAERGIPFEVREPRATYDANPGWKAFQALRRQAAESGAAGMSEAEIEAEIAAARSGK